MATLGMHSTVPAGFKPSGAVEWKAAWDLRIRADQPSVIEQLLNDVIDGLNEPAGAAEPHAPNGDQVW